MNAFQDEEITCLLKAWGHGEDSAFHKLIPLVHSQLHRLAQHYMRRERSDHTLQTTALVNEVYLRLTDTSKVPWNDRVHFFAVSARIMRCILIDLARAKRNHKHGGAERQVSLDEVAIVSFDRSEELLALDDALQRLTTLSVRQSQVVELRYFGGLTEAEIGNVLKISTRTVRQDWSLARAWLYRELGQSGGAK